LGEANVLTEFGKLQENPEIAIEYLQQAQNIFSNIGDIYSQSRNLLFIADVQIKIGQTTAAIDTLNQSIQLATTINYQPLQDSARARIAKIQNPPKPSWISRLIRFFQR
jgi:tetratricopeptide (TPR) repeat protein